MTQTHVTRSVAAPVETVFDAVAHIETFADVVDGITDVEFLTEQTRGKGTRFRETRSMKGREATTTLEVTEYDAPNLIRLVSDEGGTVWDTVFTVSVEGTGSKLEMVMDARPYKWTGKIAVPLMRRMIARAIESDMDAVKAHCEDLS